MRYPSVSRALPLAALLALAAAPVLAQQSAQHRIEESVFNDGGHPRDGASPQSASHAITLGAIGGTVARPALVAGGGFAIEGGFVSAYGPPREIANVRFDDATTLAWDPDPSVGDYALYMGTVGVPFDAGFGACELPTLTTNTAQVAAAGSPGTTLFYLVTARNRLREESTKGPGRPNPAPCP